MIVGLQRSKVLRIDYWMRKIKKTNVEACFVLGRGIHGTAGHNKSILHQGLERCYHKLQVMRDASSKSGCDAASQRNQIITSRRPLQILTLSKTLKSGLFYQFNGNHLTAANPRAAVGGSRESSRSRQLLAYGA